MIMHRLEGVYKELTALEFVVKAHRISTLRVLMNGMKSPLYENSIHFIC
jgi:hypothetical protein